VKNFNIFDPRQWSDVHGYVVLMVVIVGTLFGTIMKLIGGRWKDWLDEPRGRASIEDDWLLDRVDKRALTGSAAVQSPASRRLNRSGSSDGSAAGGATTSRHS
jgi:hypothetical protein